MRFALGESLVGVPFLTFFPAVVLAAYLGGLGPGLVAAVLSLLAASFLLIPPYWSLAVGSGSDTLAVGLFLLISVLFCFIIHGFHVAVARLREARRREREFSATLEQRVAERTKELEIANRRLRDEMVEREKAEAAARQSQKLEVIGQLTGGVAHDFNNLLTVIVGNIEAALQRLRGRDPDAERLMEGAMRGAERAAVLTHRLLAFSRRQPLAPAAVDLNKLVSGMSDLFRRTLGEHIDIETVLAGGLWRTSCDPHQLEAALLNLVVNARDAMPKGGKLTIETANVHLDEDYARRHSEVRPGQYALVAVTDTGSGMPQAVVARAFEPFFTTKESGQGTGLGLSTVFGFVKQSDGHVKIYSEPGQGTTVKVYLPRLLAENQLVEHAASVQGAVGAVAGCTILVAEDNEDVREFAVRSLRDLGYTVCEAPDGPSALSILDRESRVDVLFTDVGLPHMNGRDLSDAAKRRHPGIKVLFTTGYTRNAIVHGGRLDPGVALLPKPFTAAALARKLREVLGETAEDERREAGQSS
jgi:signal transduction histidine kinase